MYSYHNSEALDLNDSGAPPTYNDDDMDDDDESVGNRFDGDGDDEPTPTPTFEESMQKAAATWLLKMQECHRIPLSVMDAIISDLQGHLGVVQNNLNDNHRSTTRNSGS